MELIWIFLLIVNVCVANAKKLTDCRECVIFNVPYILCAPDVSRVFVTPYVNLPQYKNLLSQDCIVPLDRARPDCCIPLCSEPPQGYGYQLTNPDSKDAPIGYQETDSSGAPIDVRYGYSYPPDEVETKKFVNDSKQLAKVNDKKEDFKSDHPLLVDFLDNAPPKKSPKQSKPPKWTLPCDEPPKWPPSCCEHPNWPQTYCDPPKWPSPYPEPPTWPPSCTESPEYCESPKWVPSCPGNPSKCPPESSKHSKPYCLLEECLRPVFQNAPTSSVAFGCCPPVCENPRYHQELSKLYNKDEPHVFEPFDAGYKTGGTTRQGTVPAGKTQKFYNNNPRDEKWSTVGSRNGKDVPHICFDRDYIEKLCRACSLLPNSKPKSNSDPYSSRALEQDPDQPVLQPLGYSTTDSRSHNPHFDSHHIELEPSALDTPDVADKDDIDEKEFDLDLTKTPGQYAEYSKSVSNAKGGTNAESELVKIGQTAT